MSRSPWFMLSLAMPAILGVVTVAAVMALSGTPAPTIEHPSLDSSRAEESTAGEARARGESAGSNAPRREQAPSLTPPRTEEKEAPRAKPRKKKPANGEGPVLYAAETAAKATPLASG